MYSSGIGTAAHCREPVAKGEKTNQQGVRDLEKLWARHGRYHPLAAPDKDMGKTDRNTEGFLTFYPMELF
jgi:hypothetical protein